MAESYVDGFKDKNINAKLKHMVCSNQEHKQITVSTITTERALREICLLPLLSIHPPVKWEGIIDAVNRLPVDVAEH